MGVPDHAVKAGKPASSARMTRNRAPRQMSAPAIFTAQRAIVRHTSTRLDATIAGTLHILGQPVLAQDLLGHLDHDVVGFEQAGLQVVAVAGDALQAARAAREDL